MVEKCERCGGTLAREVGTHELVCLSCGNRPPAGWTLRGISDTAMREILVAECKEVVNDLRSTTRRADAEKFFASQMFVLMANYFRTTPKRLEKLLRDEAGVE